MNWPELPQKGFVSGRAASESDISEGNAAFVLESDEKIIGVPIPIPVPQYAFHIDQQTQRKTPGIIIQAEEAFGQKIVAMRALDGTEMVGLLEEYELLGVDRDLL